MSSAISAAKDKTDSAPCRWDIPTPDPDLIKALRRDHGLSRPIAIALANRGVGQDELADFLHPKLQKLSDPYRMPGMKRAAERLWQAVANKERIMVHGDYDADGITSTVLMTWVLRECGALVDCFLPHRMEDGYGLTEDSIRKALTPEHKLLITVDCGITSCEGVALANQMGIDVVITDHHQPGETLPEALAVLNPKLCPELEDLQPLAGVGVCFKLCHAFIKYGRETGIGGLHVDLRDGLDLVALGTVADIVPLRGENRTLVRHGMSILATQRRPGIRALCELVRLNDRVKPEDITFRLAPRINAAGRLGSPEVALDLLQSPSIVDAYPLASKLDLCNRQRQDLEEEAFQSAHRQIAELRWETRFALVAKGRKWHRGVIGIVASRLTQVFNRPTIVLSIDEDDQVHGSGRSIEGINLVSALHGCSEHLIRYGGHPMATGLALSLESLEAFEQAFERCVRDHCESSRDFTPVVSVEGDVELGELDETFFRQLQDLMPFGHSNPAPIYRFSDLEPDRLLPAGRDHTRGTLVDRHGNRMSFIAFGRRPGSFPQPPWCVAAVPEINTFRGSSTPQLQIIDVMSQ